MNELDIDPECLMTFEKAITNLTRLDNILAERLNLDPYTARVNIIALDRANRLVEDEVVADWHCAYAWYVDYLRDDYSQVAMFHLGCWNDVDDKGRTRDQILAWGDIDLERTHDHVQWLFPTVKPSNFNSKAPVLTAKDIEAFRGSQQLQHSVKMCLDRMKTFFETTRPWDKINDHNLLRMSRILDCLFTVGLKEEAVAFYDYITTKAGEPSSRVSPRTLGAWKSILKEHTERA